MNPVWHQRLIDWFMAHGYMRAARLVGHARSWWWKRTGAFR